MTAEKLVPSDWSLKSHSKVLHCFNALITQSYVVCVESEALLDVASGGLTETAGGGQGDDVLLVFDVVCTI